MSKTMTGEVKWFSKEKGYGFITPGGNSKDVFVHITEVDKAGWSTLEAGQKLRFALEEKRGRQYAVDLIAA